MRARIGIYGGTFAPPHNGHLNAANEFFRQAGLSKLYIMPTSIPPHKLISSGDVPERRYEMAKLAFQNENFTVSDYEINNPGKSYTVNTLEHFKSPDYDMVFLVGTDMLLSFDKWFHFERIFELAELAYVCREKDGADDGEIESKIKLYTENYGARITKIVTEPVVVSSSEIRAMISEGRSVDGMMPETVIRYIEENNLYKG